MKNQKHHNVGTVQRTIRKIDKIDTPNTLIHERSFSSLGTGTSMKGGWVKLAFATLHYYYHYSYIHDVFI